MDRSQRAGRRVTAGRRGAGGGRAWTACGLALGLVAAGGAPAGAGPEAEIEPRFYERAGPEIVERALPPAALGPAPAVRLETVTEAGIAARLAEAGRIRSAGLADVSAGPGAPRLVPEDLSRRTRVAHLTVREFTDAAFAQVLARVGALEGFAVVAHVPAGNPWADELRAAPNLLVSDTPGREYTWSEDIAEIGLDGSFHMTARVGDQRLLRRSLFVDRVRRFYPAVTEADLAELAALPEPPGGQPGELADSVMRRHSDIMFMNLGLVEKDGGQDVTAALAVSRGAPLREAITYLEGGNVLLGSLPGGEGYALVGRDSAAVARAFLERYRGGPVGDAETVAAMGRDLGVAPGRLHLVEQPWVFHLDMAVTVLAPGTVALNDALEAFQIQGAWMREDHEAWRPRHDGAADPAQRERDLEEWHAAGQDLERSIALMWRYVERFARYEARALADLEGAGLRVLRVPGRFLHPRRPWDRDLMNFLNGEVGTGSTGRGYLITQGGDPRAERLVARRLLAPDTGLDRVYMAPRLISRDTLWEKGGMSCRVKVEGGIAERPAPR